VNSQICLFSLSTFDTDMYKHDSSVLCRTAEDFVDGLADYSDKSYDCMLQRLRKDARVPDTRITVAVRRTLRSRAVMLKVLCLPAV
jgi:hypothetical protein